MNSLVVGISGKMGTGKTTVAKGIAARLEKKNKVVILAFGDEVKKEAAKEYGFDLSLAYTVEGKNATVLVKGTPRTVRWCLQRHGQDMRRENPHYWTDTLMQTARTESEAGANVILVEDIRHKEEVHAIMQCPHHLIFRLLPYPGYKVQDKIAAHKSEVDLDTFNHRLFSRVFAPQYGNLGSVVSECVSKISSYLHQANIPNPTAPPPDPEEFPNAATAIMYFQERRKLSRNKLAQALETQQRDILQLQTGERTPTTDQAVVLGALFETSAHHFMVGGMLDLPSTVEETAEETPKEETE